MLYNFCTYSFVIFLVESWKEITDFNIIYIKTIYLFYCQILNCWPASSLCSIGSYICVSIVLQFRVRMSSVYMSGMPNKPCLFPGTTRIYILACRLLILFVLIYNQLNFSRTELIFEFWDKLSPVSNMASSRSEENVNLNYYTNWWCHSNGEACNIFVNFCNIDWQML